MVDTRTGIKKLLCDEMATATAAAGDVRVVGCFQAADRVFQEMEDRAPDNLLTAFLAQMADIETEYMDLRAVAERTALEKSEIAVKELLSQL